MVSVVCMVCVCVCVCVCLGQFQLSASLSRASKLHSRVIWTAAWSHDDTCFATGSRDKKVR